MADISFTKVALPYGWLGNMEPYPIIYEGKEWRTVEALFQALRNKFEIRLMSVIKKIKTPKKSQKMRQQILQIINDALGQRNDYFIREQDIQLYLANYFINCNLFDNVFIEYHVPSNLIINYPWDNNSIYIDILLEKEGRFYPIEIKYKTAAQVLPFSVFGQNLNVTLGQQGAQNIGCYDFWKDAKRIEIFEQTFQNVKRGIVLFVSNDLKYQNAPLNQNSGFAPFSIHQGRVVSAHSLLDWNGNLAVANGRPGLITNYSYHINWTAMPIYKRMGK